MTQAEIKALKPGDIIEYRCVGGELRRGEVTELVFVRNPYSRDYHWRPVLSSGLAWPPEDVVRVVTEEDAKP